MKYQKEKKKKERKKKNKKEKLYQKNPSLYLHFLRQLSINTQTTPKQQKILSTEPTL